MWGRQRGGRDIQIRKTGEKKKNCSRTLVQRDKSAPIASSTKTTYAMFDKQIVNTICHKIQNLQNFYLLMFYINLIHLTFLLIRLYLMTMKNKHQCTRADQRKENYLVFYYTSYHTIEFLKTRKIYFKWLAAATRGRVVI